MKSQTQKEDVLEILSYCLKRVTDWQEQIPVLTESNQLLWPEKSLSIARSYIDNAINNAKNQLI